MSDATSQDKPAATQENSAGTPSGSPATPPAQPAKEPAGIGSQIGAGAILSGLLGLLGAAAGASWAGVAALGVMGLGLPLAWTLLVKKFNGWGDTRDLERAGADAGKTAVDLRNQGRQVTNGLDEAQRADPPTEGYPKQ